MPSEITCDACDEGRAYVDVETLEAAHRLRDRPHERAPLYNFCSDRPGCREGAEAWKKEIRPQLYDPSEVSFGEWYGEPEVPHIRDLPRPLDSEVMLAWLTWIQVTQREEELFSLLSCSLASLLASPPDLEVSSSYSEVQAAQAIAQAAELGLCQVPAPSG